MVAGSVGEVAQAGQGLQLHQGLRPAARRGHLYQLHKAEAGAQCGVPGPPPPARSVGRRPLAAMGQRVTSPQTDLAGKGPPLGERRKAE